MKIFEMEGEKKILLFVNDSYFSYLSAQKIIESHYNNIKLIVFSKATISSSKKIFKIFKKTSFSYFIYRFFIQILTILFYRKKTIEYLANKFNIKKTYVSNSRDLTELVDNGHLGLTFNFDLLIQKNIIDKFEYGIYNIHASKLPKDKGISPVLWAFARGDNEIWSTIYKLDEGVDSGPIARQFQIPLLPNDTSFSLYKRVCIESGAILNNILQEILNGEIKLIKQPQDGVTNYVSWPDKHFQTMMRKSNRHFFKLRDFSFRIESYTG